MGEAHRSGGGREGWIGGQGGSKWGRHKGMKEGGKLG